MSRGGQNAEEQQEENGEMLEGDENGNVVDQQENKKKGQKVKFHGNEEINNVDDYLNNFDKYGTKTLDRETNINLASFDTEHLVDPLFKKTTRMFDEMSLSTLMSSTLEISPNLILQIDSTIVKALTEKIVDEPKEEKSRYINHLSQMMPDLAKQLSQQNYISQPITDFWDYIEWQCR